MTKTVRGKIGIGVIAVTAAAVAVMSAACDSNKRRTETKTETAQTQDSQSAESETQLAEETAGSRCNNDDPTDIVIEGGFTAYREPDVAAFKITAYSGTEKDVSIPEIICGLDVYAIGERAFFQGGFDSVVIPKSVKIIWGGAFALVQLSNITIGADVAIVPNVVDNRNNFNTFENAFTDYYNAGGRQAGTYFWNGKDWINMTTNTFTDPRDNQTYYIVRIGNRTWFAQNLNYHTANSVCYDNNDDYCTLYGRLYTQPVAMTACPKGWRVPSDDDWNDLMTAAGSVYVGEAGFHGWLKAGTKLKSQHGWVGDGIPGTDDFNFAATPGGFALPTVRYEHTDPHGLTFTGITDSGVWWSTTEGCDMEGVVDWDGKGCPNPTRFCWNLFDYSEDMGVGFCFMSSANSIRCVRD